MMESIAASIDTWPITEMLVLLAATSAAICASLIFGLRPVLARYALAHPNARSSHREPTPQGGGIAVIAATTVAITGVAIFSPNLFNDLLRLSIVFASIAGLAIVGATDDVRPMEAFSRLVLQAVSVLVIVAMLPDELRVISGIPWWLERILIFFTVIWFVNLVNFMDGIDWMTVAEVVPLTTGLMIFGMMGELPRDAMFVASALCGAIIGFAPFNRPVARLFLGDVGSLPIGLLLGWLLVSLAGSGHFAAALLLPLYYLADATITLLRRLINGEQVLQAHRSHFYQRAMDGGVSVYQVVGRVFATNIGLVALATVTLMTTSLVLHMLMLAAGSALVGAILWTFNSARQ